MASEHLTRTFTSGNRQKWTWSGWIKRTALSGSDYPRLFSAGPSAGSQTEITIMNTDQLRYEDRVGSTLQSGLDTTARLRDLSAWYHIVVAIDITNATQSLRQRMYINGVLQTDFDGSLQYSNTSVNTYINSAATHYIGQSATYQPNFFQGNMADVFFIDGQSLPASTFGSTSATTGQWIPTGPSVIRAAVGSFGTNGFYLPFSNSTSTSTIGYDYKTTDRSSNNDWTTNNFTTDDVVATGYDNNFAQFNPLYNSASLTFTDGGLTVVGDGTHRIIATGMGVKTGKWYWEAKVTGTSPRTVGIAKQNTTRTNFLGSDSTGWGAYWDTTTLYLAYNGSTVTSYTVTATAGAIMMLAFDADAGKFWYGVNGTWLGSGNPATGANAGFTGIGNTGVNDYSFPSVSAYGGSGNANQAPTFNFGNPPYSITSPYTDGNGYGKFNYQPPSGFLSICEKNITNSTIPKGTSHFKAITYTGNGSSTRSFTGLGFKPDVVWIKTRSGDDAGYYHRFATIALGETSGYLSPHAQDGNQGSINGYVSSYDADGFSIGNGASGGVNTNSSTYVAWCWKMSSGTSANNTAGTISSTVWANPTAGQSLVRWTGVGGGGTKTVGHGLGATPAFIIVKDISGGGTNWVSWHKSYPNNNTLGVISGTEGASTISNYWGASHSSTIFGVEPSGAYDSNQQGRTMMGLVFAEVEGYSKFGSYTYNNSTDGNFIYTGFKPAFILIKNTDAPEQWYVVDSARNTYNGGQTAFLQMSTVNAESSCNSQATDSRIDIVSNGFKLRDVGGVGSGEVTFGTRSYLYAAFAEAPFDLANAR